MENIPKFKGANHYQHYTRKLFEKSENAVVTQVFVRGRLRLCHTMSESRNEGRHYHLNNLKAGFSLFFAQLMIESNEILGISNRIVFVC